MDDQPKPEQPSPDDEPDKKPTAPKNLGSKVPAGWPMALMYLMMLFMVLLIWQDNFDQMRAQVIDYSKFKEFLSKGEVVECFVAPDMITGKIVQAETPADPADEKKSKESDTKADKTKEAPAAKQKPADTKATPKKAEEKSAAKDDSTSKEEAEEKEKVLPKEFEFRTMRVEDRDLSKQLEAAGVKFTGARPSMVNQLFWWLLPVGLIIAFWLFLSRRMNAAGQSVLSFSKSRAKLFADEVTSVNFDDVAGCDEAKYELQEVVAFLKKPQRYEEIGATIPKGILLVGPPGTGKTLLARAVAGEAKVPFFSLSGSDFVEMFVGVGASRVRDLFQQAKEKAPCIIFIDELDAIGRQRGVHTGSANDEREQTLNQLLVEMDGFEANAGVILLAATNRPDVLDRALLRPGRFDRQVVVDAPDREGRQAILRVHSRGKKMGDDIDLQKIAQATPGFSGADLANALNEAALLAIRADHKRITQRDLEDAIEKVVAGPERKSRRLSENEKKRVAYHEVGHALVSAHCPFGEKVHKISIVPRGRAALGYTMHLPADDQFLMSRLELLDRIKGLLGGRAAEEVVFGDVTTGAENDLERATALALQMVCMFGMGEAIGLVHCGQKQNLYLPYPDAPMQRDCSPETEREIDQEVKALLADAYIQAKNILNEHRDQMERITEHLLQKEIIDSTTFNRLLEELTVEESGDSTGKEHSTTQ